MDWLELALPISRKYESLRLHSYLCPAGKWTVGYGETKRVGPNTVWTAQQAEDNLRERFARLGGWVDAAVTVHLEPNQKAALCLLADNIGMTAFRSSTLLRLLNANEYEKCAAQFERWNRGGGKVLPGLVTRRAEERRLFEGLD